MKLRKKTLLIISVALVSLIGVLYATATLIVYNDFHKLEVQNVQQDVVRALNALDASLASLDTIALDYGKWNDTYTFIESQDQEYIQSNLVDSTFADLRLNFFILINQSNQIIYQKGYDLNQKNAVPIPDSLQQRVIESASILNSITRSTPTTAGLLMLPENLALLAARPILTSTATGPRRGILILGRYLETEEIQSLANTTQLSIQIQPHSSTTVYSTKPAKSLIQPTRYFGQTAIEIIPINPTKIIGTATINDFYGQPELQLIVDSDRQIYQRWSASQRYLTLAALIVGLVIGGVTLFVIEKQVLSRLYSLDKQVNKISQTGDFSLRVSMSGEDELSSLGITLNGMLKALEQALLQGKESEQRYRLMAEHATDLITRHSPTGLILYASPACHFLLGYEPEEMVGTSPNSYLHPDDIDALTKAHSFVLTQNVVYTVTYRIRHRNGDYVWFETTSSTIYDQNSSFTPEILGVSRDITDRKQHEQELQNSEASIRELYQITSSRLLSFEQQIQQILRMGCRQFSLEKGLFCRITSEEKTDLNTTLAEVIAATAPGGLFLPGTIINVGETFCGALTQTNKLIYFESIQFSNFSFCPIDPRFKTEAFIGTPVWVAGQLYGTLCFWSHQPKQEPFKAVDQELLKLMAQWIGGETERQHTAADLARARDEALAATRAKSEFLATMSHEIRTPMNAVIGMTGLLLETPLEAIQQDYVETIRSSSDALLSLINDILDFSKIESGKLELEKHPFEIRTSIEESLDLLAAKAASKNLEIAYLIDPSTPTQVIGDMARLRQILVNLLSNAVKFTETGEVVVSVTATPIKQETQSSRFSGNDYEIQFAVKDTGIGIPPERMDRLFKSFSQVDSSTNRQYGGTGLGLVISQRLAEMMGGRMWVVSHQSVAGYPPEEFQLSRGDIESDGATFYFTIIAESRSSLLSDWSHNPQLQGKRLLIVDEKGTNQQILLQQAQSWGMQTQTVTTAEAALEQLSQADQFDIAILEMQIKGFDGLDLAYTIRQLPTALQLPLVLLTSVGRHRGEDGLGKFTAFLNKPIKQSQLYNVLVNLLGGEPLEVRLQGQTQLRQDIPILATLIPLRILLAEDHLVNQKVALQILQRMGYRADVAGNGLEVLQALRRQSYDVILMDMQMPEMDGLEAARQIQKLYGQGEKARSQRPRIIAVTANAMESDRAECISAGMDDYISKPIRIEQLVEVLKQCQSLSQDSEVKPENSGLIVPLKPAIQNTQIPILNADIIQSLIEVDALDEVVEIYFDSAPQLLNNLQQAVAVGNPENLKDAAHSLKSISGTLGAFILSDCCQQLELIGRESVETKTAFSQSLAQQIFNQVQKELNRAIAALQAETQT
ncbi:MAG: response regulator [Microcoleaceae cyanobacterium]